MSFFGSFWKKDSIKMQKASSSGNWQIGDKIANRYEISQILGGEGKSGMGVVYVCYDNEFGTISALKTIQEKYILSDDALKFFESEALVWTKLGRHPYIVYAEGVQRFEGRLFIFLEYIASNKQGRNTLTHCLGDLILPEILKLSIQFCYGMEYAYSKGIDCHRDIKPDNIMVTQDKTVKITDFGFAKVFQEIRLKKDIISTGQNPSLSIFESKNKHICGTLPYMAPEQFDGYADKRSDIYAFGITLYQMVTNGGLPFVGTTPEEYERMHKYENVPQISSPLFSIITKCLEKDADRRYQDFALIKEELQDLLLQLTGEKIIPPQDIELESEDWINKGISLSSLGRDTEALVFYDKALEINPKCAEAWYNKAATLNVIRRHEEAIVCCERALELGLKKSAPAWNNKGTALTTLGRYDEAMICYDKALEAEPNFFEAWTNKGMVLGICSRYDEAIACFNKALEIRPNEPEIWNNKGIVFRKLKRQAKAVDCYNKTLEIDPRYDKAWLNKGLALNDLGQYSEAISCYDKALDINTESIEAWEAKGINLFLLQRQEEALNCIEKAIKINPNSAHAHQMKQLILLGFKKK